MTVIVCVDERLGRAFLGKRLSRDAQLIADVLDFCGARTLCVTPKSARLFDTPLLSVRPELFADAKRGEVFFSETEPLAEVLGHISTLVIYRWNRHYPADLFLDVCPEEAGFVQGEVRELVGKSHPIITREVYHR